MSRYSIDAKERKAHNVTDFKTVNKKSACKNMKLKTIKYLGLGLAFAAELTTAANAQVEYTWVLGTQTTYTTTPDTTGSTLEYTAGAGALGSGGTLDSFTFNENPGGTESLSDLGLYTVTV